MTVKVVTDSTSDLPPALAEELGITVAPLNIHFGDDLYRDGVDIFADEFYRLLVTGKTLPKTSQPSPGAFLETYQGLLGDADGIVSVHVSSKVSGTMNSAEQAARELPEGAVTVVDSGQASLALGLVAAAAARAANAGATQAETADVARSAAARARIYGLVETLEYLVKGGRIGKAQALAGSLLGVKAIVTMQDGLAQSAGKARSRAKGVAKMAEFVAEMGPLEALGVMSANSSDIQLIQDAVSGLAPDGGVVVTRLGPILGVYLGPGALGVSLIQARA